MQAVYVILAICIIIILIRLFFRKVFNLPRYMGKLITENTVYGNLMPEERFWQIIELTRLNGNKNYAWQCHYLIEQLNSLTTEEIIQFDRTFETLMARSYTFKLWEPVYSLNGGMSDDGFEYFREWLIAQGKDRFYWTLKYPRLLFLIGVKEIIENYEGFGGCALHAYENKTGRFLERNADIHYIDPGKKFNENLAVFKYPELALLAW